MRAPQRKAYPKDPITLVFVDDAIEYQPFWGWWCLRCPETENHHHTKATATFYAKIHDKTHRKATP